MGSFKCSTSTHLFKLFGLHFVPWFPFSLSVGDLASVNGIHQWPIIKWWTTMFDLDTSIHIVWHVLIVVYIEYLWDWWHSTYATSFIVQVFLRCHLSWPNSNILSDIFIHYGDLVHCTLYVVMTTHDICISCLFMGIVPVMYMGLLHVYL